MLRNTDLAEKTKKVVEGEEQSYNSQRVPTAMRLEWHTGSEKSPNSNETENENGMLG